MEFYQVYHETIFFFFGVLVALIIENILYYIQSLLSFTFTSTWVIGILQIITNAFIININHHSFFVFGLLSTQTIIIRDVYTRLKPFPKRV